MLIRRFKLGDLRRIMQIERVAFGPDSYSASTFLAHVLRDRRGLLVAEDDQGEVVGYALVRLNLGWIGMRRGGITSIAVAPDHRRQGIGRALVARALEYLIEHQVEEADLEVNVSNYAAQALYRSFGFRRAKLLRNYYGQNRDGIRMVVRLDPGSRPASVTDGSGLATARRGTEGEPACQSDG